MVSFELLLDRALATASDSELNARYDGEKTLSQIGVSVPPNVRALETVVNWCRLTVDTMAEVLMVEGFESATMPEVSLERIWSVWQSANMRTLSHLAHIEALTQGVAYAIVGGRYRGGRLTGIRTIIIPKDATAIVVDDDGNVVEAVVGFTSSTEYGSTVEKAAYYTPNMVEVFQKVQGSWVKMSTETHRLDGVVPVIPIVNKLRLSDVQGRSEMELVIPYADAASRSATLLQLAVEMLSMPQRWIVGEDLSRFKKQDGSTASPAEIYLGSFLTSKNPGVKFGQFDGANLEQVIKVLEYYARMVSAMTGIPLSMVGISTGNPESAEAMLAAKERMISRGELKQDLFGDAWEKWARVVLAMSGLPGGDMPLNTVWRDIAIPSNSAKSAYLLQAHAQGVISSRTAREGLPLTPEQRTRENNDAAGRADVMLPEAL